MHYPYVKVETLICLVLQFHYLYYIKKVSLKSNSMTTNIFGQRNLMFSVFVLDKFNKSHRLMVPPGSCETMSMILGVVF